MSISVSISKSGTTYSLLAERVTHHMDRSVSVNGLPSGSEGSAGQVFVLDLGAMTQTITVEGLCNTTANYTGEGDPSKAQLETVVSSWYVQYALGGSGDSTPASLSVAGSTYSVFVKNAAFTMVGGLEDRWQYSIIFTIAG